VPDTHFASVVISRFKAELHQVLWKIFDFAKSGCRVSASETNLKNGKNARSLLARKAGVF
jgi:hypothetical protein